MDVLRNELLGALVGLARASESKELLESSGEVMVQGLAMAFSGHGPLADDLVKPMISRLHHEKRRMAPDCAACQYPCGRTDDFDMEEVYGASEALREAKLNLFSLLGDIALHSQDHASAAVRNFLSESLFLIGCTYEAGQLAKHIERAKMYQETAD